MPSPSDFRKAFHLSEGEEVRDRGGRPLGRIAESTVKHNVKKQYEAYEFPTTLKLSFDTGRGGRGPSSRAVEAAVRAHAGDAQMVYSAYGSPYSCSVKNVKVSSLDEEEATVKLLGRAERRRDVPTLGERKEAERKDQGGGVASFEVSKEGKKSWMEARGERKDISLSRPPRTPPCRRAALAVGHARDQVAVWIFEVRRVRGYNRSKDQNRERCRGHAAWGVGARSMRGGG